jgi:hypothetical protein
MLPSASILNYTTLADVTNSWKIGIYEVIHGSHSLLEILRWIALMSVSFNKNDVTQAKNVYKLWLP